MWPIFLRLGDFELGTYGVLLMVAVLVALYCAAKLGQRDDLPSGKVIDIGVITVFSGIAGSKLLGVGVAVVSGAPLGWSEFRNAGAVHGGLLGGLLAIWLLTRHYKLSLPLLLDAYVPAAAFGQAIGRLGCLAAGCCFGTSCDLPWAVTFEHETAHLLGGVPLGVPLHPVQLYDAAFHLLLGLALTLAHRRRLFVGRLIAPWCIAEGLGRFLIETYRGDLGRGIWFDLEWLSTGRLTALGFVAVGLLLLAWQKPRAIPKEDGGDR